MLNWIKWLMVGCNGRNALSWEEKFARDVWYVDHFLFRMDIEIIVLTFIRIGKREDINHPGHVMMKPFEGGM